MPEFPTYMTTKEAAALADDLAQVGGARSVATRIATLETEARTAARLIRALLKPVNPSDVFELPPEA